MSDSSVNEATLALKGLLGIRSGFGIAPEAQEVKEITNERKKNETSSSNKKKKKNSNSSDSSSKASVYAATQLHDNKMKTSKGNPEPKARKKKSDKITASKSSEKFALSAFQSPPDPSTLPLPSFHSHDEQSDKKSITTSKVKLESSVLNQREECKTFSAEPLSPNTCSSRVMTSITLSATSVSDQLNNSNVADDDKANEECKALSDDRTDEDDLVVNKMSQSGVDLAMLALKGSESRRSSLSQKSTETNIRPSNLEIDPIALLLKGESYGTKNTSLSHSPNMIHPQHSQFLPPQYGYMHPNYDTFHPYPMHPMYHPHQSFTTIQVQVPHMLLPGNQMLLPASPLTGGYPLPITLPENAQPGMIIPVTIPLLTNPTYPYMNMSMAPSPHPVYSTSVSNYYNPQVYAPDLEGNHQPILKSWVDRVSEPLYIDETSKNTTS